MRMVDKNSGLGSSQKVDVTPKSTKSQKRKRDPHGSQPAATPTPTKKHKKRESLPIAEVTDDSSTKKRKHLKDALQGSNSPGKRPGKKVLSRQTAEKRLLQTHATASVKRQGNRKRASERVLERTTHWMMRLHL
jgi:hypothetical protein